MQEQQPEPSRRPAQQFATVDLRRPKGYAAVPAPPQPAAAAAAAPAVAPAATGEGDPCPRCESRDTKFCYYNNYNTSQPRHFCKSCRRYWTKGGTLRNVPVGGGTRKKSSSSSSSFFSSSATASASAAKHPKPSKKRRVTPPEPAATPVPTAAAADPASKSTTEATTEKTSTTTTTTPPAPDTASEITTELVVPAVEDSFTDLLQPDSDTVTLGFNFSDYPSITKSLADPDLHLEWPAAAFDMASYWPTSAGFTDSDPTAVFLNLP